MIWLVNTAYDVQKRAFTASAFAKDRNELATLKRSKCSLKHFSLLVAFLELFPQVVQAYKLIPIVNNHYAPFSLTMLLDRFNQIASFILCVLTDRAP